MKKTNKDSICVWCNEGQKVHPLYGMEKNEFVFEINDSRNSPESGRCLECWAKDYPTAHIK